MKLATTGELPPNAKGGAFVHDPLMMDDKSVKAEVKLAFRSVSGDSMICSRPMLLTLNKRGTTFKSMDGQLLLRRGDTRTTLSTKLSELKEQVPRALGVPAPILEHVIFCHQEDSLWPLSESAVLKKRFDAIFQASHFTKALEQIKTQRKKMLGDMKVFQANVNHLEQDKERADRTEEKMKVAERMIENYKTEADILREELDVVVEKSDKLFRSNQEFQEVLARLENLKNEEQTIEFQITKVLDPTEWLPDSDEELNYKAANFQQLVKEAEVGLSNLKVELARDRQILQRLRSDLNHNVGQEGLLKGRENSYNENLSSRFEIIQRAQTELNLELQVEDFNKVETQLMRIANEHEVTLSRLSNQFQLEEAALSMEIKTLSDSKIRESQHKQYTLTDISTAQNQTKEIQTKLNNLDLNESDVEYEKTSLLNLESKLSTFRANNPVESLVVQIKQNKARISSIENEIEELNKDMSQIHKQSELHAKISIISEQKERKQTTLSKLLVNHNSILERFGINVDELTVSFRSLSEENHTQLQHQTAEFDKLHMNCNNIKNVINFKRESLSKLQTELQKSLTKVQSVLTEGESADDYPEILKDAEIDHKNALENLKMRSTTLDFNRKALAFAEQESNCYLCMRKFEEGTILSLFITGLKSRTNPDSEKVLEQQLEEAKDYLEEVKSIRSDVEKVKDLSEKIANLENDLTESNGSLNVLQKEADAQKIILDLTKAEKEGLEELRNPISEISRLQNEINSNDHELGLRKQDLINFGLTSKSLEEVQQELSNKSEELKALRRNSSFLREEKESRQRELTTLEGGVKDARLKIANLGRSLNERGNLKRSIEDLSVKVRELNESVVKIDEMLQETDNELNLREAELDSLRDSHHETLEKERKRSELEKDFYDSLRNLNEKINLFLNQDLKHLESVRGSIKSIRKQIESLEERTAEFSESIAIKANNLQDGANQDRILRGNIELRQLQTKLSEVQRSISEIDIEEACASRDRYIEESRRLSNRQSEINAEIAGKTGEIRQISDQVKVLRRELDTDYKDVKQAYVKEWVRLEVTTIHEQDLNVYAKALDNAIMNYHAMKMKEINKSIDELWKTTYKGTDVDTIRLQSDYSDSGSQRSYNYKVVMIKQDVQLDMRGRCSAGQKVLASIIIRLALSECFGTNCGVIALDEPTTNLDADNIESLAKSLSEIIELRKKQNNFQLIVITHDEKFLLAMQANKYTNHYYRISRDQSQKSRIETVDINKIVD